MKKEEIISVFNQLRKALISIDKNKGWEGYPSGITEQDFIQMQQVLCSEKNKNPWFTEANMRSAVKGIIDLLEPTSLFEFQRKYNFATIPKCVAIIMAGNIPFVGFHDVLCVLLSGNKALCKLSSDDKGLPQTILQWLLIWKPQLVERLEIAQGPLKNFDAVIATGSNNTINQFQTYFKEKPSVFRKNKTSIAVLDGSESFDELEKLSTDCFQYFGMGCRNVSKLFIPTDFNLDLIFEAFLTQKELINHHKYGNNYDYHRTIYLMNQVPFLDNNCFMMREETALHAPLSVIYYERYSNQNELIQKIRDVNDELQAVIGRNYIPFGAAQHPTISDFADGIDTMKWLNSI